MGGAMWKLHRYYLRELVVNSAITFLVMFAVVLVSLVARGIQRSMGGGMLDAAKITLFWALALWAYLRALDSDSWADWLLLGVICGLGLLSKYTMAA